MNIRSMFPGILKLSIYQLNPFHSQVSVHIVLLELLEALKEGEEREKEHTLLEHLLSTKTQARHFQQAWVQLVTREAKFSTVIKQRSGLWQLSVVLWAFNNYEDTAIAMYFKKINFF